MKKIMLLILISNIFHSCQSVENSLELSNDTFYKIVKRNDVQKLINTYGEELRRDFNLKVPQIVVFISNKGSDTLSLKYVKIDSLTIKQEKIIKYCNYDYSNNIMTFYLCKSKKISLIKSDCLSNKYDDNSETIQDYYPHEILIFNDSIISNQIIESKDTHEFSDILINNETFIPPIIKK